MPLAELEYDFQEFQRRDAGDEKLFVVFFPHYVADAEKSDAEGRPIFKDEMFIRIVTPGDRNNVIERPIRPDDKRRFKKAWDHFQAGEADLGVGTRLEEWPSMSRAMVQELKHMGFRTVEHIAEARDDVCERVAGLTQLKQRAKAFLEYSKSQAPLTEMHAELEKRDAQIAALQQQVSELALLAKPKEGAIPAPTGKPTK